MISSRYGLFFLLGAGLCLQSCHTYKNIAYFRDVPDSARITVQTAHYNALHIQKGDMLSVNIQTIDPTANAIFNQVPTSPIAQMAGSGGGGAAAGATAMVSGQSTFPGYEVNDAGMIELPLLGKIPVEGLTTSDASDTIENRVVRLFKTPSVTVRFANLKVSVLGEVLHPGVFILANEKNTILDALSMAGDMTIFGKRQNVLLIRDSAGHSNFIRFNLNSKDLVRQDYYFLRQNDVLYIEPGKGKAASLDAASLRNYAIITSVLTLLIVVASRIN
jgi:polysaccharide export outer membrane protein